MATNVMKLLNKFVKLEHELEKKGIGTKGGIVCGYGEYLASRELILKILKKSNNKGFDGLDSKNMKYEIKTIRTTHQDKLAYVFKGFRNKLRKKFDYLVGISLDRDFNINLMFKMPYATFIKHYKKNQIALHLIKN